MRGWGRVRRWEWNVYERAPEMNRTSLRPDMRKLRLWRTESVPSGSMGPFSPQPMHKSHRAARSHAQAAGVRPGVCVSALYRHTRLQDAYSIDLPDSEKELDQRVVLLPLRSRSAAMRPITHTITLTCQLSSCVVSTRSEATLNSLANLRIVGSVCA